MIKVVIVDSNGIRAGNLKGVLSSCMEVVEVIENWTTDVDLKAQIQTVLNNGTWLLAHERNIQGVKESICQQYVLYTKGGDGNTVLRLSMGNEYSGNAWIEALSVAKNNEEVIEHLVKRPSIEYLVAGYLVLVAKEPPHELSISDDALGNDAFWEKVRGEYNTIVNLPAKEKTSDRPNRNQIGTLLRAHLRS